MIEHPTLYTLDAAGKVRTWRMVVDGPRYQTVAGVLDGTETYSGWTEARPKNIGKSNATTAEEQAQIEVAAEYRKKLDRKYHDSLEGVGAHKFFAPMLAEKFRAFNGGVVFSQPKLDGFRCIAAASGLTSRQGKEFRVDHIRKALEGLFQGDPDLVLDGELYNHNFRHDFNEIASLIKNPARGQSLVQYHIYDVPSEGTLFSDRRKRLQDLRATFMGHPYIKIVPTHVAREQAQLDDLFAGYLLAGYEGQMVRLDMLYERGKRSNGLLKRKEFQDAEFPVSAILEGVGNWAGYAKAVEFILPRDRRTESGERPKAGIRGTQAACRELLENSSKYTSVTVRFLGYTPGGIPRCPVAVAWHEGERTE